MCIDMSMKPMSTEHIQYAKERNAMKATRLCPCALLCLFLAVAWLDGAWEEAQMEDRDFRLGSAPEGRPLLGRAPGFEEGLKKIKIGPSGRNL